LAFNSGREADHSPPSSAEIEEWVELYLHSPMRLHGVVGEHRDNFTFYLLDTTRTVDSQLYYGNLKFKVPSTALPWMDVGLFNDAVSSETIISRQIM
jgi:hypothetical protein